MVFDQFGNGMQNWCIGRFAKVPVGNGASQSKLLTCENELSCPDQTDQVQPEHVSQPVGFAILDAQDSCI